MAEVSRYGTAAIKRAYDVWTTTNLKGWKEVLHSMVAMLILCSSSSVFAQAGAGGAVSGIFWIFIWGLGLVALLILFVIGGVFGARVAGVAALVAIVSLAVWLGKGQAEIKQRESSYATVLNSMASECLSQGKEEFNQKLSGKEKISFVILGQSKLPERQQNFVIDTSKLPGDFFILRAIPVEMPNEDGVLVVLTYDRDDVSGSSPDYLWQSTKIDVSVRRSKDGVEIAHRRDIEVRQGFCLSENPRLGVIDFLQTALGRPDIYSQEKRSIAGEARPFHYTPAFASFDLPVPGVFNRTLVDTKSNPDVTHWSKLRSRLTPFTCNVEDVVLSSPVATCAVGTKEENKFSLHNLIGVVRREHSWLTVFRLSRSTSGLGGMRIEERDLDGKPLSAWIVNFPDPGQDSDFSVQAGSIDQPNFVLEVLWKRNSGWSDATYKELYEWFELKSNIRVNLVGLR